MKRQLLSGLVALLLALACVVGVVPGDVACCAGWMPLHGPDCCAGHDADSRRCCEGESGLQQPDRSVIVSVLPSALSSTFFSPPEMLVAGPEPVTISGPGETATRPLYRLHASLLL